jgi:teichuronic acid biosynthesis glycosyltransferase TuaC
MGTLTGQILTFTNLFPSSAAPTHGLFVQERMRRVIARTGMRWQVVAPVPWVPLGLRDATARAFAKLPERETVDCVVVHHPRYFHLPGLSLRAQARRMARGARDVVARLVDDRTVLDAHYVYPDGVAALRLAQELKRPCVVTARGTDLTVLGERASVVAQLRALAGSAHALLAVSDDLRRRFVVAAGVPDTAVRLARNGVDLDRLAPGDVAAARAALGLPADRRLVLGVGRLVSNKGFHLAAAAVAALDPETKATLVLVGDGPEAERIRAALPPDRLVMLGRRAPDDVALAFRACEVFVLPTEREGWPNVVTEALASGIPVVAHAVGGIPEILTDPAFGRLVTPGDSAALVSGIADFLRAPPTRDAVRAFARRYSFDDTVRMLADLFTAAVA